MSKTSDEIILRLLKRVEAEEEAKACLECDLMELANSNKELKTLVEKLEHELKERDINIQQATHRITKLSENDEVKFINFIQRSGECETLSDTIKNLNKHGFLNCNTISKVL